MKHVRYRTSRVHIPLAMAALLSIFSMLVSPAIFAREAITQQLIDLYTTRPEIQTYLNSSLAAASAINPNLQTNPAQTLSAYLDFVDSASKLAPKEILNNPPDLIRDQILQSITYFYFLIDQPLEALEGKGLYKPALQYYPPFAKWTRDFATTWGAYLNTTASWSSTQLAQFQSDPLFRLNTGDYEASSNWNTFNRFFSRYLASPSKRPIASPNDDTVVVSPADSVPQGVWDIDDKGNIQVDGGLKVKNLRYFNIGDLLGPNTKQYASDFYGGRLTHTFLNVYDYHRYHFPVAGRILQAPEVVQQNVALEVTWNPTTGKYVPIDSTGWQFTQTRGIVVLQTDNYGKVALIPMGMAHVSSVNFESYVLPDVTRQKGDMLGTFLFGGSDYIILFEKAANFRITAPEQDTQYVAEIGSEGHQFNYPVTNYEHVLMGNAYGKMGPDSSAPPSVIFYLNALQTAGNNSELTVMGVSESGWNINPWPLWNDSISHIVVNEGYTLEVYEHANYGGAKLTIQGPRSFTQEELQAENFDNTLTSYKVFETPK